MYACPGVNLQLEIKRASQAACAKNHEPCSNLCSPVPFEVIGDDNGTFNIMSNTTKTTLPG